MFQKRYESPLGIIKIKASETGLQEVLFMDEAKDNIIDWSVAENEICTATAIQLDEYFKGERIIFDLPLSPVGTEFQQSVWKELLLIPFGKTSTYSAIANSLNNPLSVRAVGTSNGKNPIAIIIPCHRVIGADGTLTGYAGGLWRKELLLKLEGNLHYNQPTLWDD
ncbi:methylated-DNA--[protein]-cysteine S-methyltransferase [Taibaiella lutea]|uniref:Methylated-DNA--protein-cysteine methyltransferase n=1 Tax=Taibaiella lutea TaxID=2608001 RepID=A0A5M6CH32_9BACT|nr:methylated-DNA--[protein]-cysteine S-methyltransferase [Taibaiella lutea]KAA5533232.1 methylated-DNA--[protein]-cysteine S-methyltransferase [Taibaiella lutea]